MATKCEQLVYETIKTYNAQTCQAMMSDTILERMHAAGHDWRWRTIERVLDRLVRTGQVSVQYHPTQGMGEFYYAK